jgi:hypothetical protein
MQALQTARAGKLSLQALRPRLAPDPLRTPAAARGAPRTSGCQEHDVAHARRRRRRQQRAHAAGAHHRAHAAQRGRHCARVACRGSVRRSGSAAGSLACGTASRCSRPSSALCRIPRRRRPLLRTPHGAARHLLKLLAAGLAHTGGSRRARAGAARAYAALHRGDVLAERGARGRRVAHQRAHLLPARPARSAVSQAPCSLAPSA